MARKEKNYDKKALYLSSKYGGKITIKPTVKVRSMADLSAVYTPGIAAVSERIVADPESSYEFTWRWNTIFIITNGTRVLGLGNEGPLASLPVMEGKSLLYKLYGGVNAIPIPIKSTDPREFTDVVDAISITAGGIHLEDIASPFCFDVLERLRERISVPVWHDDQQGTAGVTLAGLINAFKLVEKDLKTAKIVLVGAGAANIALFNLLEKYGVNVGNIIVGDSKGPLNKNRLDIEEIKISNRWKYNVLERSNHTGVMEIDESFDDADAIVGFSRGGSIMPSWIKRMAKKSIVFANANPTPEIWPAAAKKAGAYIVSTGRSDYPNQINNSLVFPGLFRGVLDSRAKKIDYGMIIAAAEAIAKIAERKGLKREFILPKMGYQNLHAVVAASVAEYASKSGNSAIRGNFEFFYKNAKNIISKGFRR
jgi:malate dehydrogenase (oxaloacetate-decarboxylating)/malate dehydrogenase (oxaloacetate-decarboxylating)(NADP+)